LSVEKPSKFFINSTVRSVFNKKSPEKKKNPWRHTAYSNTTKTETSSTAEYAAIEV